MNSNASTVTVDALLLAWLRTRLPETAAVAISAVRPTSGAVDMDGLLGEEPGLVRHGRAARRAEFRAGRVAARQALWSLGIEPRPLMAHPVGDPLWPPGVVGSISHTSTWAVATVARRDDLRGIGVDLEDAAPLEPGIVDMICRPEERLGDPALERRRIDGPKLRFVAKEAWYKAVFPEWRRFVGFDEVIVDIDAARDSFHARFVGLPPLGHAPPSAAGGFVQAAGLLCAVCTLSASPAP